MYLPRLKELHFFNERRAHGPCDVSGATWTRPVYFDLDNPEHWRWYSRQFLPGADKVKGEITPDYSTLSKHRVGEVKRHLPDAKIIAEDLGIITPAVEESLGAIGEALESNGKVIVTGCLGERPDEIMARHPSVLAITGHADVDGVMAAVHETLPPDDSPFTSLVPPQGVKLTPRHYSYLKIAEGCNHKCSFCIIPQIRGDLVSRPAAAVVRDICRSASPSANRSNR